MEELCVKEKIQAQVEKKRMRQQSEGEMDRFHK